MGEQILKERLPRVVRTPWRQGGPSQRHHPKGLRHIRHVLGRDEPAHKLKGRLLALGV